MRGDIQGGREKVTLRKGKKGARAVFSIREGKVTTRRSARLERNPSRCTMQGLTKRETSSRHRATEEEDKREAYRRGPSAGMVIRGMASKLGQKTILTLKESSYEHYRAKTKGGGGSNAHFREGTTGRQLVNRQGTKGSGLAKLRRRDRSLRTAKNLNGRRLNQRECSVRPVTPKKRSSS